jgi:hypothetical protein
MKKSDSNTNGDFMKSLYLFSILLFSLSALGAVNVPHTFTSNTSISSAQMNNNFNTFKVFMDNLESIVNSNYSAQNTAITTLQGNISSINGTLATHDNSITNIQSDLGTLSGRMTVAEAKLDAAEKLIFVGRRAPTTVGTQITTMPTSFTCNNVSNKLGFNIESSVATEITVTQTPSPGETKLTFLNAGLYRIVPSIAYTTTTNTVIVQFSLRFNASEVVQIGTALTVPITAGDYVYVEALCDDTFGTLNINNARSTLLIYKVK